MKKINIRSGERYERLIIIKEIKSYENSDKKYRKFLCMGM